MKIRQVSLGEAETSDPYIYLFCFHIKHLNLTSYCSCRSCMADGGHKGYSVVAHTTSQFDFRRRH